jgi:TrmH family RNA methyltransferase
MTEELQLTKARRQLIRSLSSRHGRKRSDSALCEGKRAAGELFSRAPELVEFAAVTAEHREFADSFHLAAPVYTVTQEEMAQLSGTVSAPGIIAVLQPREVTRDEMVSSAAEAPFLLVCDQVSDPGNLGTILRTALAAGLKTVWLSGACADVYSPKVIRSALGAQFALVMPRFASLPELLQTAADSGFTRTRISDPHTGYNCFSDKDLFNRSVVVIGSEAHGVDPAQPGERVQIPMPGNFESLNAAQAATILIFEYVRRITS